MQEKKKEQTRLVALVIGCVMCMSAGCYFAASMPNETTNQQGLPGEQTPLPSAVADYMLDRNNTWTYPGASINQPRAITASYGGYFYTTSLVMRSGYYVTLAKWDEFGSLVWNRTWYNPCMCEVRDVHYLDRPDMFDDEVWVIGNYYPTGISYMNIFWLKYSSNGTFMGNWTWGGPGDDVATCADYDGTYSSFTLWGYTNSWKAKCHILRATIWTSGAFLSNATWGDNLYDYKLYDADSDYYTGSNDSHVLIGKWSASTPWRRTVVFSEGWQYGTQIIMSSGLYVYASTTNYKPKLISYSIAGAYQWNRSLTFTSCSDANAMGITIRNGNLWTLTGHWSNTTISAWTTSGTCLRNITRVESTYHFATAWAWWYNSIYVASAVGSTGMEVSIYSEDLDGDGMGNTTEKFYGSSDLDLDSDDDTMPDGYEVEHNLDPADAADKKGDLDGDRLANFLEFQLGTDIEKADTDGDGWSDRDELLANTSPFDPLDFPSGAIDMNIVLIASGCIAGGFVVGIVAGITAKKKKNAAK